MSDEPIDEEVSADREAVRAALMRRRKPAKLKKVEPDDKSDLDWGKY